MVIPPITEIVYEKIDFIGGLLIGASMSIYSWYERKKKLRATLYYPLWLACHNVLLLFDKIDVYWDDGPNGKRLFNSAVKPLNDIMYNYGTAMYLEEKLEKSGEEYIHTFFRAKRTIDLNQEPISNWDDAKIWFKHIKVGSYYTGDDNTILGKIDEFKALHEDLTNLKEFCERKDKSLKGEI